MTDQEAFVLIVDRMRGAFDVRRIILFGSRARDNAGPESDYDVLVEVESDVGFWERQRAALRALGRRPFAIDLVVLTPREIEQQLQIPGSAADWALVEGRELYAR